MLKMKVLNTQIRISPEGIPGNANAHVDPGIRYS